MIVLDGPMGTRLGQLGADLSGPSWSARADPALVRRIHAEYAAAGATVHTANTFRTRRRAVGHDWQQLAARAVAVARDAVPGTHRVAGSLAPLEDCYRPDLSPPHPRAEHRELARHLAACGVDLLLVETFPHVGEALIAVEEAVATGVETWLALTAGYDGDLLTPDQVAAGARQAVQRGASAVLVNCVPATDTLRFVRALADAGAPFGAYANAGHAHHGIGWSEDAEGPTRYAALARSWIDAGATLVGGCCGTGPEHVRALARLADHDPTGPAGDCSD